MPMKKFRMTNTELKLKRQRMMAAYQAGKKAIEELGLPYFLAYGSALGALREGQFQPYEDDINVGIYSWDLAELQRNCPSPTAARRDGKIISVFERCGFEPVSEVVEGAQGQEDPQSQSVCPRTFLAENWSQEMAFPILYKFTHRESLVRFDMIVFTVQFGQLWDFADGGAETSSGWRYAPFSPQPIEFEKIMTYTMPTQALEEHYGEDWHVPRVLGYIENLSRCQNRCQVLRVHPWEANQERRHLPAAVPWEEFKSDVRKYRIKYAKAMSDAPSEFPAKALDLYKIESKPMVLFQAAEMCRTDGNARLKNGNASGALDKYDEGLYIMDKCREVLTTWRLIFRQIHLEKAENNRKERGLKFSDMAEPDMPNEFRADEADERSNRMSLLLNAAQAALQAERWEAVETHTSLALEQEPKSLKALYRRGMGRLRAGREETAKADFWAMLKASGFESKEAMSQLLKLMSKEEFQKQWKKVKAAWEREKKVGTMLVEMDEDDRIASQDERYERYKFDCEQRKADGQREISFDDWVLQYEWRYDAEERGKIRQMWPETFSHMGAAPLPIEEWEVDYLTHKEVDKIVYHRQTAAMAAKKRQEEGARPEPAKEGFVSKLQVDEEDRDVLREAVIQKGYRYWW